MAGRAAMRYLSQRFSSVGKLLSKEENAAENICIKKIEKEKLEKAARQASNCAAGDSASYHRTSAFGDDVVIVAAYRSPLCKAKRGAFKDTYPDDLLAPVLKALIEKTNVNPAVVGDIVVGTVFAPGSQRASKCRMAAFYAGFPETVPVRTVNRQCSSGLQAVADVAAAIKAGFYDIGIGAGLESMTTNPMAWEGSVNPKVKEFAQAQDCLLLMGVTSENVAHRFGVTRQEQDQAAVDSHRKAAAATAAGKFKDEIIPVRTKLVDPKTGDEKPITVSVDDGIRASTTVSDLAKLRPVFKKDGTTTAGNSSQVTDGAGAVLLMKRSLAMLRGLPILGVFSGQRDCIRLQKLFCQFRSFSTGRTPVYEFKISWKLVKSVYFLEKPPSWTCPGSWQNFVIHGYWYLPQASNAPKFQADWVDDTEVVVKLPRGTP